MKKHEKHQKKNIGKHIKYMKNGVKNKSILL